MQTLLDQSMLRGFNEIESNWYLHLSSSNIGANDCLPNQLKANKVNLMLIQLWESIPSNLGTSILDNHII